MPSAAAITRSSGVVMNPRTRSALAPTYAVVTVIAAFSLRGYCRTLSVRIACTPAMTTIRLTTIAMTGRRMKRSVNFMADARGGLLLARLRVELRLWRERVVHHHRHAVSQLERAAARDHLAGLHAADDLDEVAPTLAEPDELLAGHLPRAVRGGSGRRAGARGSLRRRTVRRLRRVLRVHHREHGVSVRRVQDRRGG